MWSIERVTDAELVDRVREGDVSAFGELVDRHRVAAYRAALAALRSPEEAEEATQDAFVAAYFHLERFRGDSSFKTWVLAIAWRHALTRRKSLARRLRRFVSLDGHAWPEPAGLDVSQECRVADAELRAQIRRLLVTLPAKLRDTLLLAQSGEYGYREIAEILAVPEGTVKWRVMEARRILKQKLRALGYGHE